jgi:hypothetical protein
MKKYIRIFLIVVVAAIFISTFAFLYVKSQPKEIKYEIVTPKVADIEKVP